MAPNPTNKKLSTLIKNEKKIVSMAPGAITLRPKRSRTVQLETGGFTQIEDPAVRYECLGDRRSGHTGRELDPSNPVDREILDLFEDLLERNPWMATDVRYRIEILGEHQAHRPWSGYDEQTAEEARGTWDHMPAGARPDVARAMKYELEKPLLDEDGDPVHDDDGKPVLDPDPEKVAMWDEIYKAQQKAAKAGSQQKVDLS